MMMMPQTNFNFFLVFIFAYYHFLLLCCLKECELDTADNEKHKVIFPQPPISTFTSKFFSFRKEWNKKIILFYDFFLSSSYRATIADDMLLLCALIRGAVLEVHTSESTRKAIVGSSSGVGGIHFHPERMEEKIRLEKMEKEMNKIFPKRWKTLELLSSWLFNFFGEIGEVFDEQIYHANSMQSNMLEKLPSPYNERTFIDSFNKSLSKRKVFIRKYFTMNHRAPATAF